MVFIVALAMTCMFSNMASADLTDGLVAYLSFDNCDAGDISGNGNNGTVYGTPTCIDSKIGKAFNFDGIDDYIDITNNSLLNSENTVAFWAKTNQNGDYSFVSKATFGNGYGIWLGRDENFGNSGEQGKVSFGFDGEGIQWNWHMVTNTTVLDPNEWYHIVAVLGSSGQKLYINGVEEASNPTTETSIINAGVWLGREMRFGNGRLNGVLDEFRIYNRALSEAEIQELYNLEMPAVSGCINLKGSPVVNATVVLKQRREPHQITTTDSNGCYKFENVVSDKKFNVIINGPIVQ